MKWEFLHQLLSPRCLSPVGRDGQNHLLQHTLTLLLGSAQILRLQVVTRLGGRIFLISPLRPYMTAPIGLGMVLLLLLLRHGIGFTSSLTGGIIRYSIHSGLTWIHHGSNLLFQQSKALTHRHLQIRKYGLIRIILVPLVTGVHGAWVAVILGLRANLHIYSTTGNGFLANKTITKKACCV